MNFFQSAINLFPILSTPRNLPSRLPDLQDNINMDPVNERIPEEWFRQDIYQTRRTLRCLLQVFQNLLSQTAMTEHMNEEADRESQKKIYFLQERIQELEQTERLRNDYCLYAAKYLAKSPKQ